MYKAVVLTSNIHADSVLEITKLAWSKGICIILTPEKTDNIKFCDIYKNLGEYLYIDDENHVDEFNLRIDTDFPDYNWSKDEIALVLYTSGSTGSPKGVCHSYQNIIS